jgi:Beta-galactosidase
MFMSNGASQLRITLSALLVAMISAFAAQASTPLPPPSVCVESSCVDAGVAPPSTGTGGYRWHPGIYERVLGATPSQWQGYINELANHPQVVGIAAYYMWKDVEPSKGSYNWSTLDRVAEISAAAGKYFIFRLQTRRFNSTDISGTVPSYVVSEGLTYKTAANGATNVGAALWRTDCMDYYIAAVKAMMNRYANNPYFAGVLHEESVFGQNLPSDYSASVYVSQELRAARALRNAQPTIPFGLLTNFLNGSGASAQMDDLMFGLRDVGGVFNNGGPDTHMNAPTTGTEVLLGSSGGFDFRGKHAVLSSSEFSEGATLCKSPAETWNKAVGQWKANYVIWMRLSGQCNGNWEQVLAYTRGKQTVQAKPSQENWSE